MKTILLTQGQSALVDDEDFEWLSNWKWCAVRTSSRKTGKCAILMHREILTPPFGMDTDHKDLNGLNNCRCTEYSESTKKMRHIEVQRRKWQTRIGVNYKDIWLGYFNTEEAAARAYDEAARRHFGEFANMNF